MTYEQFYMPSFYKGRSYRINPSWPGPSKPETVEEYEDALVKKGYDSYYCTINGRNCAISIACICPPFRGYVMPDGSIRPRMLFDQQKDGTYRLRVPKAVRLVKEVAK